MKYLIINADDFGMCHSVNLAINDLFQRHCITSTTLIACAPWAKEAVKMAKENKNMKVGVHLTHTSEWETYRYRPLSNQVASLQREDLSFYQTTAECLAHGIKKELMREVHAQIKWVQQENIHITHLDNHMFSLVHCVREMIDLCISQNFSYRLDRQGSRIPLSQKAKYAKLVQIADENNVPILDYLNPYSELYPSDCLTYESCKKRYEEMLRHLPDGISEFYTHPAMESDELKAIAPDWPVRVNDYLYFGSESFKQCCIEENITLISWDDLDILCNQSVLKRSGDPS